MTGPPRPHLAAVGVDEWLGQHDDGARATIETSDRQLRDVRDDAIAALVAANDPPVVFERHGELVRLRHGDGGPGIELMGRAALRDRLADVADWVRTSEGTKGGRRAWSTPPPSSVVEVVEAHGCPGMAELRRVVHVPVFGPEATITTTPGYDAASRTWLHLAPGFEVPDVPEHPSDADVGEALRCWDEVLHDFPFTGTAERAHALCLGLQPFARDLIDGPTPLYNVEAPTPRTGKGKLVAALLWPALGKHPQVSHEVAEGDEWAKRILAWALEGAEVVVIDNLTSTLISGALASAIVEQSVSGRQLGRTRTVSGKLAPTWVLTANNPTFSRELAPRAVRVRLDPGVANPESRSGFRHDPLEEWVAGHRSELVWAALVIVQAWVSAGRPSWSGKRRLGGFEAWVRTMGGVLEVAGVEGFLENLEEAQASANVEDSVWEGLFEAWWTDWADAPVTSGQVYLLANRECCELGLSGAEARQRQVSLGRKLGERRDRVIGRWKLLDAGSRGGRTRYRLAEVPT